MIKAALGVGVVAAGLTFGVFAVYGLDLLPKRHLPLPAKIAARVDPDPKGDLERSPPVVHPVLRWDPSQAFIDALPSPEVVPQEPPKASREPIHRDICERTGGRRIETRGGRSWRCSYPRRPRSHR